MIDSNSGTGSFIFGLLIVALGVWIVAARGGAHAWLSNTWRIGGDGFDSWMAMLLGPRIVSTLTLILGIACIVCGALIALAVL
jgi:hypothetical protein